ncbi:MAG TPA: hypothetical protein VG826_06175 [Pirellulales bacterium]|nr:hypothetical protein [Pirellulales bacterium]
MPRPQFTLRALLVAMLVVAIGLTGYTHRYRAQNAFITSIDERGGAIYYQHDERPESRSQSRSPCWFAWLFDGDKVETVVLRGRKFDDGDLRRLALFPNLKTVIFETGTITEAGVSRFRALLPDCDIIPDNGPVFIRKLL